MKYDILESARAELDRVRRAHHGIVTRAAADVRASKAKLAAAGTKVRNLEFSVAEYEIDAERARRERASR